MELLKFGEQLRVRYNSTIQVREIVFIRNVECQVPEDFRAKAQRPVEISIRSCRFSSVWCVAVDEKDLPGGSCMPGAPVRVLLDTLLDKANDEMLMRMAYESVLHIMRMNDLCAIRRVKTIKANPLWRGSHLSCCDKDELSREVPFGTA